MKIHYGSILPKYIWDLTDKKPNLVLFSIDLKIPLNFCSNAGYKQGGFSKTLLEKSLKFVLSRRDGTVALNLSFVLLSAKADLIPEK